MKISTMPSSHTLFTCSNKTPRAHSIHQKHKINRFTILCNAEKQDTGTPPVLIPYKSDVPIPIRLNNIPHSRETRKHFYAEVVEGVKTAINSGETLVKVVCRPPELNTEFDVYRVGTMLELVRELATELSADGKHVKCCVQQSLGEGVFSGTPLSLSGVMRIMKQMEWGPAGEFVTLGNLGAAEVEGSDFFIIISPQNIVGSSVIPLLIEMSEATAKEGKTIVLINPSLGDVPSSGGVMGVRGRQERMDYIERYITAYHFRLLYKGASMFPIMGVLRYTYGGPWQVFKRHQFTMTTEEYQLIGSFDHQPGAGEITQCFQVKQW